MRLSCKEALEHVWFKNKHESEIKFDKDVLDRLKEFKGVSKLKKAAMNMLIKMADQEAIEDLREQFYKLDKDRTGMVDAKELKAAIQASNIDIKDEEVEKIIGEVDYFGNGMINYTEFLVATLDVKTFLDNNMLQALFVQFDTDSSGYITKENIITAMGKLGHQFSQEELNTIMAEHDSAKDGRISFNEFKCIFLDYTDSVHGTLSN